MAVVQIPVEFGTYSLTQQPAIFIRIPKKTFHAHVCPAAPSTAKTTGQIWPRAKQ